MSIATTVQVTYIHVSLLDFAELWSVLSTWAEGDENLCTTGEKLVEAVDKADCTLELVEAIADINVEIDVVIYI